MLTTERLLLRPCRVEEAAVLHRLWTERDPRVPPRRRLDPAGRPTVEMLADELAAASSPYRGLLALQPRTGEDVIGYCGLVASDRGTAGEPELAFELLRSAWGQGYATEAGRAVLDWAVLQGHRRVWAGVWDWNTASLRVLTRLGFAPSGREEISTHGTTLVWVRPLTGGRRSGDNLAPPFNR